MIYVLVNDNVITLKVSKSSDDLGPKTAADVYDVGTADVGLANHVRGVLVRYMENNDVRTPMDERLKVIDMELVPYERAMIKIRTAKGKALVAPTMIALARANMRDGDIAMVLDMLVDYANLKDILVEPADEPEEEEKEDNIDELVRVSY